MTATCAWFKPLRWRTVAQVTVSCALPLAGACHIERIQGDGASEQATAAPKAALSSSPSKPPPLTPFRALLENAWSERDDVDRDQEEQADEAPAGVWVLVAGPQRRVVEQVSQQLCEALFAGRQTQEEVASALALLECQLPASDGQLREALIADSRGAWGASLAVEHDDSAVLAAMDAMRNDRGLVMSRRGTSPGMGAPWPLVPPADLSQAPQCLLDVSANESEQVMADASTAFVPSNDGGVPRSADAAVDAGTLGDGGLGGTAGGQSIPTVPLVFAAVRDAHGVFVAGVAGVDRDGVGMVTAGNVAVPMHRLVVGSQGVLLVDPLLDRTLAASAATKAYASLIADDRVDEDVLWLRGADAHSPLMEHVRFIHLDTSDLTAHCPMEVTR